MTHVTRLLTFALVAAVGLTFSGAVAAITGGFSRPAAVAAKGAPPPAASRAAVLRPDGNSTAAWGAADAADQARADERAREEFNALVAAAILDLTPPPAPAPEVIVATAPAAPSAPRANPAPPPAATYSGSVPDLIRAVFAAAGQGGVDWALRVAKCESGFNPNAYNASSGASGVFQFLPSTWRGSPYASSSPFDANANVRAALWLYQRSGPNQWSCT